MNQVNILIVVNVAKAVSSLSNCQKKPNGLPMIGDYVFLLDTAAVGPLSNGEGSHELVTNVINGGTVVWKVVAIDPNNSVEITGFTSEKGSNPAYPDMIDPSAVGGTDGTEWHATVKAASGENDNGQDIHNQYSVNLTLQGDHKVTFDPFLFSRNKK